MNYLLLNTLVVIVFAISFGPVNGQIPGGFHNIDANNDEVQGMADRAVMKYNTMRNGIFYMTKVKIISARQQLVAGTKTVLEILVQESTCEARVNHMTLFVFSFITADG
ncbi:unnamed protein product [Enterobius vermicularis]|uniref:Cystatin domain-containing protein n=1 Tax=Enterobius vermicularis TaxID=51028 RepID=A0A0N4UVN9_ENTVE|nr:unnamed protein product [Enterobius vermicularis]